MKPEKCKKGEHLFVPLGANNTNHTCICGEKLFPSPKEEIHPDYCQCKMCEPPEEEENKELKCGVCGKIDWTRLSDENCKISYATPEEMATLCKHLELKDKCIHCKIEKCSPKEEIVNDWESELQIVCSKYINLEMNTKLREILISFIRSILKCNCYSLYNCIYCKESINVRIQPWGYQFPNFTYHLGCKELGKDFSKKFSGWKKELENLIDSSFEILDTKGKGYENIKPFISSLISSTEKRVEHCAEPKCPECNILAYNKGKEDMAKEIIGKIEKNEGCLYLGDVNYITNLIKSKYE